MQTYFDARYIQTAPVTSVFSRTGVVIAAASDYDANQVDVTPAGNIAATDVQAAIEELDDEKVAWNSTTGLASPIATGSRILIGDATTGAAITATDSVLIGQAAGQDLTSGTGCVAIGTDAMAENVTGVQNTCLGYQAGKGIAGNTHSYNTFIGYKSGFEIRTGIANSGIGALVLGSLTNGNFNMALGNSALGKCTAGQANTAIGVSSLGKCTTGSNNTGIGASTLGGITSANESVAIGTEALAAYLGSSATAIGYRAATALTWGAGSTAIGHLALQYNVTGSNNTCIGQYCARGVAGNSHADNTCVGWSSGRQLNTGGENCLFGSGSGDLLTTGATNVFAGMNAGGVFTTGSGNICIGHDVGLTAPTATTSNQLFIDNADVDEDNVIIYAEMDNHVMKLNADVRITEPGVETADARGQCDIIQTATDGAEPVLVLDQDDISEEFIKFYGSAAAATLTQSLVAEADVTTATRIGFLKVDVQDEGDQIADGAAFIPIFTLA